MCDGGGEVGAAGLDDFGAGAFPPLAAVGFALALRAVLLGLAHVDNHGGGGGGAGVELILLPFNKEERKVRTPSSARV